MDAILFAAAHIARREGAAAVTTDRVARAAGVSIGSLYQYFANRDAILTELRSRHRTWLGAEVRAGIELGASRSSLRDAVRGSIERIVALQRLAPPTGEAGCAPLSPETFAAFRERTQVYLRTNAAQLRPVDPELAAVVITRAAEALLRGLSQDEPHWLGHPAFVDEVTELVVGYLTPRE